MFPHRQTDTRAFDIAQAMLDGFNRHCRLFREPNAAAKARFEAADWLGQQRAQALRIQFYDQRMAESADRLHRQFDVDTLSTDSWQQVKLHNIGLLTNHHRSELVETFFNSVTVQLLHRSSFRNDFIVVRPALSTEYIEDEPPGAQPTFRAYDPTRGTLRETLHRAVPTFRLQCGFEDLGRDIDHVIDALGQHIGLPVLDWRLPANVQIQVLSSLLYRDKGAHLEGRVVNGFTELPFALAILHGDDDRLVIDTAIFSPTSAIPATPSASRRASRAGSCGSSTCRAFPTCSRSSRTSTSRRGTPRATRSRPSTCRSSSTTVSAAGPIRWRPTSSPATCCSRT